jgi:hypothetical protein
LNNRILKVITKEPAGQREFSDPRVQQAIRSQLRDRREQLLKAAYYEVLRDSAVVRAWRCADKVCTRAREASEERAAVTRNGSPSTPLPVPATLHAFVRQSAMVPVRIALEEDNADLQLGISAIVGIKRESGGLPNGSPLAPCL